MEGGGAGHGGQLAVDGGEQRTLEGKVSQKHSLENLYEEPKVLLESCPDH